MKEIKKLEMWSISKIFGIFGFVLGLLSGLVAYFGAKYFDMSGMMPQGMMINAQVIFAAPILNAVVYFLFGIVFVLVYNFVAPRIGGFKVEFK
ncbi:DUF3566 domain-containing protein [Candidatus Woesearchaeota archaeon]|nr:DUF3566 domain-containing protein [Candidatus Woesearchaeota archaeon]